MFCKSFSKLNVYAAVLFINLFEQSNSCFLLKDLLLYYITKMTPGHHHRSECKMVDILTWISFLDVQGVKNVIKSM